MTDAAPTVLIVREADLPHPAAAAWAVVGRFDTLADWLPPVASQVNDRPAGRERRTLTLAGNGAEVVEERIDDGAAPMSYAYVIVESPLPLREYRSEIVAIPTGPGSCRLRWTGSFRADPDQAAAMAGTIGGLYEAGIAALRGRLGG